MTFADRISRRIKLHDLDILLAVVETGTMGKAAERLKISQPAVSKAIADLEHTLRTRLFDRTRRGVEVTSYGIALARRSVAILDELRQGVQDLEFLADPTAGELRIGSTDFVMASIVSVVIDRLSVKHSRINFHVLAADPATLRRELIARKIELLVGRMYTVPDDEALDTEVLCDDPLVVVADRQHLLFGRRKIKLTEIVQENWTLPPPDTPSGSLVLDIFQRAGLEPPRNVVSTYSLPLRQYLVATGHFITVLPKSTLHVIGERLSLFALPVVLPAQQSLAVIATLKGRSLSPLAQFFVEEAREIAKAKSYNRYRPPRRAPGGPAR
jgi:DNA-binding transcriptional LysR family regulator